MIKKWLDKSPRLMPLIVAVILTCVVAVPVTYALVSVRTYPVHVDVLPGQKNITISTSTNPGVPVSGFNFAVYRGGEPVTIELIVANSGQEDLTDLAVDDLNLAAITIDYTPNAIASLPVGSNTTVTMSVQAVGNAPLGPVDTMQEWYEP